MNQNNHQDIGDKLKETLAEFLGTEPEEIADDDSLIHDLQMKASELTDFLQRLQEKGWDTTKLDFNEIDTVSDLIEAIGDENI